MNTNDKKPFYDALNDALSIKGRILTKGAFNLWFELLEDYHLQDVKAAIKTAMKDTRFDLVPANVIQLLPCPLGHVTRELAWSICPKTPFDGDYVTDEIMQARGICAEAIEGGDRMARMAFLEAYDQLLASARVTGKIAVWWYTSPDGGTSKQRQEIKLAKTLEAAQCGRLTQQRAKTAVQLICDEFGTSSTPYLTKLPGAMTKELTHQMTNGSKLIGNQ
jgi:hypothetical protein